MPQNYYLKRNDFDPWFELYVSDLKGIFHKNDGFDVRATGQDGSEFGEQFMRGHHYGCLKKKKKNAFLLIFPKYFPRKLYI